MALRALTALPQPVSKDVERMLREALTDDLTLADGPIGAWKHAAAHFDPEFAANDVHVLFVVKSPGAWLTSIYRRPYHRQNPRRGSLHYFTTSPWICVRRELTPNVVANPIALWNIKVRSYLDFAKKARGANVKCMFVRSEDLILDQVNTVRRMADWLGIEPAVPIVELTSDTKNKGRTLADLKRYYGEELWRSEIDDATSEFISRESMPKPVKQFGYGPP